MPPDDGELHDANELQREIEQLRADLERERRRATESEYRADNLDQQVSQSGEQLHQAQLAQLSAQENAATDAINATQQEIAGLKTQLANLQAEGKFEEAADVQEKIGDAAARRQHAVQAKSYFAQQKNAFSAAPADPVERFLADNRQTYTNDDMEWIRANRRYATDPAFRGRVIQAHGEALQQGLRQRSPEYYRFLEDAAYMRPAPPPAPPQNQQQTAPPAPMPDEAGAAPTGYAGEAEAELEPEVLIREEAPMAQNQPYSNGAYSNGNAGGEAFGRQAQNPQPRAAGNGSLRAVAGMPSRRSPTSNGRRTVVELTPDERDTAIAVAPHMAPSNVLEQGQAGVLRWWHDLKYSAAAERIRREWSERR